MSTKTKNKLENQEKSEPIPIKNALKLLLWVIFSIITINLIVRLVELYINYYGLRSFLYLLILLFSIGSIFIIYPKINRRFKQDQMRDMEKNLKKNVVIGYLVKVNDANETVYDYLDLGKIMNRKNLKVDKKCKKRDKKTWLEEENKLFKV